MDEINQHVPGDWREFFRRVNVIASHAAYRNPKRLIAVVWPCLYEPAGYTFWNYIDQETIGM